MTKLKFTKAEDRAAAMEGWSLFECSGGRYDGQVRIQKIDDPENYPTPCPKELTSDDAAIRLVRRKAAQGSALHVKALKMHGETYPLPKSLSGKY